MASLFTVLTLLAALFGGFHQTASERSHSSIIYVTNEGPWGDWHSKEMCPDNSFAIGFSLRMEPGQGRGDDTALNGIRLYCAAENREGFTYSVESHAGYWGHWTTPQYCPSGVLTAFQLSVEAPIGRGDDTAANNIKFRCSTYTELEGEGMPWGEYGAWSDTCYGGGICGIRTKVEGRQGEGDDTALNDVYFYCCDRPEEQIASRSYRSILSVANGGIWGDWHSAEMCPENSFAVGFSQRVEPGLGDGDDTALNGIRLYCAAENYEGFIHYVESHAGYWGDWTTPQYCPSGVLSAFQLSVEAPIGRGDDTAANNIKFRCSTHTVLEGEGMPWGEYGAWSDTCYGGGICGIRTKVEGRQGEGDDTALNDVHFYCCSNK